MIPTGFYTIIEEQQEILVLQVQGLELPEATVIHLSSSTSYINQETFVVVSSYIIEYSDDTRVRVFNSNEQQEALALHGIDDYYIMAKSISDKYKPAIKLD